MVFIYGMMLFLVLLSHLQVKVRWVVRFMSIVSFNDDLTRRDETQLQNGPILSPWFAVCCCPDAPDTPVDAAVVPVAPALFGTLILLASPFSKDKVGGKENNNIRNLSQPRIRGWGTGCATIQIYDVAYDLNLFPDVWTRFESLNIGSDSGLHTPCSRNVCTT